MINFLFLGFCLLAVFFSLLIIVSRNPIHSILYLILVFCCVSFIFLLLGVEFISIIFLIVYVGAIAVLFLFVVMMLNIKILELDETFWKYAPVGLVIVSLFLFELIFIIFPFDLIDLFNLFRTCNFFEIKNIVVNDYTQFVFVTFRDIFYFDFSYNFYDNTTLMG